MSKLRCRKRAAVRQYLLDLLTDLRREFAQRLKVQREKFPNQHLPCDTCAFRTSTDGWIGFEQTVINLVAAMEDRRPFYCHHRMEQVPGRYVDPTREKDGKAEVDWERMDYCAGWLVLASNPPLDIASLVPAPMRAMCVQIANDHAREIGATTNDRTVR